ncbi:MAG TPA: hypothetical protein VJ784_14265 [Pyrinomonadaceae bacterium]|nr:hypothetical protein [Pyrinomonadaceae bacterium]
MKQRQAVTAVTVQRYRQGHDPFAPYTPSLLLSVDVDISARVTQPHVKIVGLAYKLLPSFAASRVARFSLIDQSTVDP